MTPATGRERRVSERAEVAIEIRLVRKVGATLVVRSSDLGVGGARVVSRRPLRIDEELQFDIELPSGGAHLSGIARVLRQPLHDTYALRFEHIEYGVRELDAFVAARLSG